MTKIHTTAAVRPSHSLRKELKHPDEFITLSARALAWARSHQTKVIVGAAALFLLMVATAVAASIRSSHRRDANVDLARALASYRDAPDSADAGAQLQDVARRWRDDSTGALATFVAGASELRRGNADSAIVTFGELGGGAAAAPFVAQGAVLGAAFALERSSKLDDALAKYNAATTMSGPYVAEALRGTARVNEALGHTELARAAYERLNRDFPGLPDREAISAKIGQ